MREIKSYFILVVCIFHFSQLKSQNLVSNSSFENYSQCPYSQNQLSFSTGWINPTTGSPDYYNICSSTIYSSVPQNFNGYSVPYTGNAYSGLVLYHNSLANGREYIETLLTNALQANKRYLIKMYASLADSSEFYVKNICCVFSSNQLNSNNFYPLNYSPQLCIDSLSNFSEDKNWIEFSGYVIADGGEKYLTIGNFNNDNNTDTVRRVGNYPYPDAYYYIDDISVIPIPEIEAGPNVQIIQGNNAQFNATVENGWNGLQYRWRPSVGLSDSAILNPIASPSQTITYYLHLIDTSGTASFVDTIIDSLKVTVVPNGVNEIRTSTQKMSIFPNPANSSVSILGVSGEIEVVFYDPLGEVVLRSPLPGRGAEGEVNIEMLQVGIYFVRVRSENGEAVGRFVKQ